jgi:hypothetical protein
MRPYVFGREDEKADKQKKHSLQNRQKQSDKAEQNESPTHDQEGEFFNFRFHVLSA